MLDNRLEICAEMVSGKGIVCDVGTDHAYLAVELIRSGRCKRVIASDINEGPLESARRNIAKYGVSDSITTIISNGLENVPLDGVSDIVIAGMGGETIAEIILNGAVFDDGIRLILQPMTKPEILRKKLYEMFFEIVEERAVEANGKVYTVICAEFSGNACELTEFEAMYGFFDPADELTTRYRINESERLAAIARSLRNAGKSEELAAHYEAMSKRMLEGVRSISIDEFYGYLDEKYPFALQEKWDNSGMIVNTLRNSRKVMLTLDITKDAVGEARRKGIDVIISHHPVIFDPLKRMDVHDPVFDLVKNNISAICMHTNLDIAKGGTNSVIVDRLSEKLEFSGEPEYFEEMGGDNGLGYIIELREPTQYEELAAILKDVFGCPYVRMNRGGRYCSHRIAICSGSGGSMLSLAEEKGCDSLITGDVKHDVMITANNRRLNVYDCGHFHTENLVLPELRRAIEEKYPLLDVEIAESSVDPCMYL